MPNYWLGIMAVALALTLTLWIALVFRADSQRIGPPQESEPHREVMGGAFAAREGGRQVMPDPEAPLVPEGGATVPEQPRPEAAGQVSEAKVPEQRKGRQPEQAQSPRGRFPITAGRILTRTDECLGPGCRVGQGRPGSRRSCGPVIRIAGRGFAAGRGSLAGRGVPSRSR